MKLLFVIVGLLVVSVELGSAGRRKKRLFDFNSFFKKATARPQTKKPTAAPVTTATEPPRQAVRKNEIPYEVLMKAFNYSSEAEFRKGFGLPNVDKRDEISGQAARSQLGLKQSADGVIPDVDDTWHSGICHPRQVLVNLREKYFTLVKPACILVKRCSGCCASTLQHCFPVEKKLYFISGWFYSHAPRLAMESGRNRRSNQYSGIYPKQLPEPIEAHTKCECQCIKSAADCNSRQYWDQGSCKCKCRADVVQGLNCQYPIEFNDQTCKCECVLPPNNNCDLGKKWSHEACQCVCKNKICQHPEKLNQETCQCESS